MASLKYYIYKTLQYIIYKKWMLSIHRFLASIFGENTYYAFLSHIETGALIPIKKKVHLCGDNKVYMMFDGRIDQAGLADNLRALSSVYYLCKKYGKNYKIVFHHPFHLEKFLKPNKYNWEEREGVEALMQTKMKDVVALSYNSIFGDSNKDLQRKYLERIISESRMPIRLYTNTFCYDEYFYDNFNELFKPTTYLERLIEEQMSLIGGNFISASFRFANLMGDIDDNYGKELTEEGKMKLMLQCSKSIEQLHEVHQGMRILITSDSKKFLNMIQSSLNFVYVIPGDIGHVAHNGEDSVVLKTFLDLFVISKAEHVYMVRSSIMYKSGFSLRAAKIGNRPFSEIKI